MPEGPAAVRSLVAVGAGFFAIQFLTLGGDKVFRSVSPQSFDANGFAFGEKTLMIALCYVAAFEAVGGYITARLAIHKPLKHALALGLFMLALNLLFTAFTWGKAPAWYQIASLAIIVPMILLGGQIHGLIHGR